MTDTTPSHNISPREAFIRWFDAIPAVLRKNLAHLFRICTVDDTAQMAAPPRASLEYFRTWAGTTDFPLRIAARMFYIRSIFDMVICHHNEILSDFHGQPHDPGIIALSDRQWQEVLESWTRLRNQALSDAAIHSWAFYMIRLQKAAL